MYVIGGETYVLWIWRLGKRQRLLPLRWLGKRLGLPALGLQPWLALLVSRFLLEGSPKASHTCAHSFLHPLF